MANYHYTQSQRTSTTLGKTKRRSSQPITFSGKYMLAIIYSVVFSIFLLLLFQVGYIYKLNKQVTKCESELEHMTQVVDNKKRELLMVDDLVAIENLARSYGMKELEPEQYIYERIESGHYEGDTSKSLSQNK